MRQAVLHRRFCNVGRRPHYALYIINYNFFSPCMVFSATNLFTLASQTGAWPDVVRKGTGPALR